MSSLCGKSALSRIKEVPVIGAAAPAAALAFVLLSAPPARAQRFAHPAPGVVVTIEPFYEPLLPYGEWTIVEPYGWVWSPASVAVNWRPYSTGHWVPTDQGWLWEDDAPWGWAPFHYGRWAYEPALGWVWIPGAEWAPAWVTWRYGEGWVGWAPLSPRVAFRVGIAADAWEMGVSSTAWCFVAAPQLLHPHLHAIIVAPTENIVVVNRTRNITRYSRGPKGVLNEGLGFREAERLIGRRFVRRAVVEAEGRSRPLPLPLPAEGAVRQHEGRIVEVYRPVAVPEERERRVQRAEPRFEVRERPQRPEQIDHGHGDRGDHDGDRAQRPLRRGNEGGARAGRGRRQP